MSVVSTISKATILDVAAGLSAEEARWLVDYYYAVQDYRIQATGQARAVAQNADEGASVLADWLGEQMHSQENEIKRALNTFSDHHLPGRWAKSIVGIGPVIAAGLLAHIDITKAPTAGHIWRFAGLDPSLKWHGREGIRNLIQDARKVEPDDWRALVWLCRAINYRPGTVLKMAGLAERTVSIEEAKELADRYDGSYSDSIAFEGDNILLSAFPDEEAGEIFQMAYPEATVKWTEIQKVLARRPWNAKLKVLCWKMGDSFVKQKGHKDGVYGRVYAERKEQEVERNEAGLFADQAEAALKERNIRDKDLKTTYEAGRLPAGRLDLRARRYAVKLFLSHYHHVAYVDHFGELPPKPYVIEHGGDAHFIAPPNWPM